MGPYLVRWVLSQLHRADLDCGAWGGGLIAAWGGGLIAAWGGGLILQHGVGVLYRSMGWGVTSCCVVVYKYFLCCLRQSSIFHIICYLKKTTSQPT